MFNKLSGGQMLVELLLVIGLSAIIFPALLTGFIASREGKPQQKQRMQATTLLQETQQAASSVRDTDWPSFASFSAVPLHPVIFGGRWALAPGVETIGDISRQIVINDVYRDANGAIATTGGTLDPSTKKITTTVSWTQPSNSSISSVSYLTHAQNISMTQTTTADFQVGNTSGTIITSDLGGEIQLEPGRSNWCQPSDAIKSEMNLPKPGKTIVAFPGATANNPNKAYIGTGDGSAGESFVDVEISNPQVPSPIPTPSIAGSYSSSDTTNAVFSDGTYGYLATTGSSNQVKIIRLSDYSLVSQFTPSGSAVSANGVYVNGNILYVTSGNYIYTYNVANKLSPTYITRKDLGGTAKQVVVKGTKAFVTRIGWTGLRIYTTDASGNLTLWSTALDLSFWQDPKGLVVNDTGTRAYVAYSGNTFGDGGFFIVNSSSRFWFIIWFSSVLGVYDNSDGMGGMDPMGMTLATNNKAIIVGTGGSEQYQVIDISNDSNPTHCGGIPVTDGGTGVAAIQEADSDVYAYLISGSGNSQFKIIEGGNGGTTSNGTFESGIIDLGSSSVLNWFKANVSEPANTIIKMQLAVAPEDSGSCNGASYYYIGPDKTANTYFTTNNSSISAQIPYGTYGTYQNPARCFRYKTWFETLTPGTSPIFYDMNINYTQ